MDAYEPKKIESKWQQYWFEQRIFAADQEPAFAKASAGRTKKYVLDMFPYPSGDGLHVGHGKIYTGSDILARFWRKKGFNVLHPTGWDAFGLPTENSAIKFKIHPAQLTKKNTDRFREQMRAIGFSYDWDREINTTDPSYYKWTQWIFLQLFKKGLAYEAAIPINWCPKDKTGLANEEVVDGKCERCGTPVELKPMRQWLLKITAYADRLLTGLEGLDWPEFIKDQQRNWIGKSEGRLIDFAVADSKTSITVFTTRPDTILGATYVVLAPEHPLVAQLITQEQRPDVAAYAAQAAQKKTLDRTDLNKAKTGMFTGSYAINPATKEKIPVWVADYVLTSYGTGAIMAVPTHDERDAAFAAAYSLPVGSGELTDNLLGTSSVQYKLRDWVFSRQRYWGEPIPIIHCNHCGIVPVPEEQLPVELPPIENYEPTGTGDSPLAGIAEWVTTTCPTCAGPARRETNTMPQWAGSSWYWLRFIDPQNSHVFADREKLKQWLPVDIYVGGAEHAVLHLLYARFWNMVLFDLGLVPQAEPFQALRNVGLVLGPDGQKMSKSRGNVVNPDDIISEYGADTLRLYEMFMGPFDNYGQWQPSSIAGVQRFLKRVWQFVLSAAEAPGETSPSLAIKLQQTIVRVTQSTQEVRFNTAIAAMMELLNDAESEKQASRQFLEIFLQLLNPYAPHITEELWQRLGHTDNLAYYPWPVVDEAVLIQAQVTIAVQVNGKVRGTLQQAPGKPQADIEAAAKALPNVAKYLNQASGHKIIFVADRLINFVVG